jgi:hypothetical protein
VGLLGVGVWVGSYTLLGPEKTPGRRCGWWWGVCLWSAPGLPGLTHSSLCTVVRVWWVGVVVGVWVGVWLCVECCIVDASVFERLVWFVWVKCVRAHGGCLGIRSR